MENTKSKKSKVQTISNPVLPHWADSALFTVGGRSEILYTYRKDDMILSKFVSPENVARAYAKISYDTGDIPIGIMRMGYGPNGYWGFLRSPGRMVYMSFGNEDYIQVPIPGTVIFGVAKTYYIFAEKAGKLFKAPFDNVYENGKICWGNNAIKPVKKAADLQTALNLFFAAPFTDDMDANNGRLTYKELYYGLAKKKAKKYTRKLQQTRYTVDHLVKIALGKGVDDD